MGPHSTFADYQRNVSDVTTDSGFAEGGCRGPYGKDIDGCSSITPEFGKCDYFNYREGEAVACDHCGIMLQCEDAYSRLGMVRNVIDLMSDFASSGISLNHPNPSIQRYYQNWFDKVQGVHISERILSNLFKFGTAIVRRTERRILKKEDKALKEARADYLELEDKQKKNHIPSCYRLQNPCMIDVVGGTLCSLTGEKPQYGIKIPFHICEMINNPSGKIQRDFIAKLPKDIRDAAKNYDPLNLYPLDNKQLEVIHYKKDCWQNWAKPIIYSVLLDIQLLNKLKLADFSVLDSALDMVRIYKLGDIENKIMPGPEAFTKLKEALLANNAGGIRNILWGPDIELVESKNDGYQILGAEKYGSTLDAIHSGLGIPPSVTGAGDAGTTNNLISLKVLIKRLCYGRQKLVEFWDKELKRVQKAKGFRLPAQIEFEFMNLGDEEAEKRLWIELADRDIVSQEWVQKKLGANSTIEKNRLNRERRERDELKRVPKAGPWHDPQWDLKVKKDLVAQDRITLESAGLWDVVEKAPAGETNTPTNDNSDNLAQTPGRPPGKTDQAPRKKRAFQPQIKAMEIWAKGAQTKVNEVVKAQCLGALGKKSLRNLTAEQSVELENVGFQALMGLAPNQEVGSSLGRFTPNAAAVAEYSRRVSETELAVGSKLSLDDRLTIQREIYLEYIGISDNTK